MPENPFNDEATIFFYTAINVSHQQMTHNNEFLKQHKNINYYKKKKNMELKISKNA